MANVNITFNGKEFLLSCDDGQEEHLVELSEQLNNKFAISTALLFSFIVLINPLSAETVDRVVAIVNSDVITLSSVRDRFMVLNKNNQGSENSGLLSQKELMENALNLMIEEKLKVQEAIKSGLEVSEETIINAFDSIKNKHNYY